MFMFALIDGSASGAAGIYRVWEGRKIEGEEEEEKEEEENEEERKKGRKGEWERSRLVRWMESG